MIQPNSNDKWLVVRSSGAPGVYSANLDDVPFPPANSDSTKRTGMSTLDKTRIDELFYPLSTTDLSTATGTNNIGVYDSATYLVTSDGAQYGLPADNGIGMGVNGQSIFPIYNNNAKCTHRHSRKARASQGALLSTPPIYDSPLWT